MIVFRQDRGEPSAVMPGSAETIEWIVQQVDSRHRMPPLREPIRQPAVARAEIENLQPLTARTWRHPLPKGDIARMFQRLEDAFDEHGIGPCADAPDCRESAGEILKWQRLVVGGLVTAPAFGTAN